MKQEIIKAREYLFSVYSKMENKEKERLYWLYRFFIQDSKYNRLKYNGKLEKSVIIKHNEDRKGY